MPEEKEQYKVFLIDDETLGAEIVQLMLASEEDIEFKADHDARTAFEKAQIYDPTIVLVDLRMPLIDGFDVIRQFRSCPALQHLPIVMLSSEDDPALKAKGFALGANDYLVKWPDKRELIARIRYHSRAYRAFRERDNAFSALEQSQADLLARTQELELSRSALLQAQKMEALGNLTGGISHDFNNVLQIINGSLSLLKLQLKNDEQAQKRIEVALGGVSRGAKLSSQLLSFARRQPLQPKVTSIGKLCDDVMQLLRHGIGLTTPIEVDIAADLWNVLVDPAKLENVLFNLAINARDAMPSGGIIRIAASNMHLVHADIIDGDYVHISVQDSGCGMTDAVAQRVFEPFFTTKPDGQGSGLGLSMAYGFVKQSKGHIEIESALDVGTTVHIYLPRAQTASAPAPKEEIPQDVNGAESILVVDDEEDVRQATGELLRSLGYRVVESHNGEDALEAVKNNPDIDLIFTDVVMPGKMRSVDFVAAAQALRPDLPVLFTSGYVRPDILSEWKNQSHIRLLSKPYDVQDLATKIRKLLDNR
ncbi:MAG: response regulator [Oxalicibacterium faecigallinarum]|uniref:response regulator n=1 Tax=Oxalicibacterium faecigallinarum TaxID=573741 RepID=UPI002808EBDF|nr:response regulator [Oxalicibacterium faecigallinarum]MDQ7970611.1 response regulator [Oxalicibacterium faecigallinarum]